MDTYDGTCKICELEKDLINGECLGCNEAGKWLDDHAPNIFSGDTRNIVINLLQQYGE